MFDWFWRFLYQISKGLFWAIDMIMQCVNKICGIEPINLGEEKIDFLTYLLTGHNVRFAFAAMALLGIVVVVILSIFSIATSLIRFSVVIMEIWSCSLLIMTLIASSIWSSV